MLFSWVIGAVGIARENSFTNIFCHVNANMDSFDVHSHHFLAMLKKMDIRTDCDRRNGGNLWSMAQRNNHK